MFVNVRMLLDPELVPSFLGSEVRRLSSPDMRARTCSDPSIAARVLVPMVYCHVLESAMQVIRRVGAASFYHWVFVVSIMVLAQLCRRSV